MNIHKPPGDIPGNAMGSADQHARWLMRIGSDVLEIDRWKWEPTETRPVVTAITIRCDPDADQGVLAVVKGYTPQEAVVAFQREETVADCLVQVGRRLRNGSLKWRRDKPYDGS